LPPGQDLPVTERRSPFDTVLDLVIYAPVGFVLVASEEIPKLAAKGRAQLGGQLAMAKVVGKFAVAQGRRQLAPRLSAAPPADGRTGSPPATNPSPGGHGLEAPVGAGAPAEPEGLIDETPSDLTREDRTTATGRPDEPNLGGTEAGGAVGPSTEQEPGLGPSDLQTDGVGPQPGVAPDPEGPDPTALAIPGYDSLAASQVVARLAGLSAEELAAVAAYERAHRARRTILTRVQQLQER
jgi:hypothetical protein